MSSHFNPDDLAPRNLPAEGQPCEPLPAELADLEQLLKRCRPAELKLEFDELLLRAHTDSVRTMASAATAAGNRTASRRWLGAVAASWVCGAVMGAIGMLSVVGNASTGGAAPGPGNNGGMIATAAPHTHNENVAESKAPPARTMPAGDSLVARTSGASEAWNSPGRPMMEALLADSPGRQDFARWRFTSHLTAGDFRRGVFVYPSTGIVGHLPMSELNSDPVEEISARESSWEEPEPRRPMTREELMRELLEEGKGSIL